MIERYEVVGLSIPGAEQLSDEDRVLMEHDVPFLTRVALDHMVARLDELSDSGRSERMLREVFPSVRAGILDHLQSSNGGQIGSLRNLVRAAQQMAGWVPAELIRRR